MRNRSLEDLLEAIIPGQRQAKAEGRCPTCGKPIGEFRDDLSRREFTISGMCQECQDSVFNSTDEDDE